MRTIIATLILAIAITASAQRAYKGDVSNNQLIVTNEQDLVALAAVSNLNTRAWQNPASATNWTWTSDGKEITLTNYNFASMDVVIPDTLDGLPVTGFSGPVFNSGYPSYIGTAITSVSGDNIKFVSEYSLACNTRLASVNFPKATRIDQYAFYKCAGLQSIALPLVTTIGAGAFEECTSLSFISIPLASSIGGSAFMRCTALTSMVFSVDAPVKNWNTFSDLTPGQVKIYINNPTAKYWDSTWGSTHGGDLMPVVRVPVTSSLYTGNGSGLTNIPYAALTQVPVETDPSVAGAVSTHNTSESSHANQFTNKADHVTVTNIVETLREYHTDTYTNIIWRSVYSNGWMWLVAHTNYPAQ